MRHTNPFGLSLSFDRLRMIGEPFALSLSKGPTDMRDFGAYRWKNRKPFKNLLETPR